MTNFEAMRDELTHCRNSLLASNARNAELLEALKALRHEYLRILVDYGSHVRGNPVIQALADNAIAKVEEEP